MKCRNRQGGYRVLISYYRDKRPIAEARHNNQQAGSSEEMGEECLKRFSILNVVAGGTRR